MMNGKAALVTGGAKRIGRGIARHLAENGWDLVIHYRTGIAQADTLAGQVRQLGRRVWLLQGHLDTQEGIDAFIKDLVHLVGSEEMGLSLVINNASLFNNVSFRNAGFSEYSTNLNLHAITPLLLARAVSDTVSEGLMINLIDSMVWRNGGGYYPYRLSKRLLGEVTTSLAVELAPRWRVNGIAPGAILPAVDKDPAAFKARKHVIPLARTGRIDDLLITLDYLIRADFVTGQLMFVDGGEHLLYTGEESYES